MAVLTGYLIIVVLGCKGALRGSPVRADAGCCLRATADPGPDPYFRGDTLSFTGHEELESVEMSTKRSLEIAERS